LMKNSSGLVSVIIPTYNRSSDCKIAVESVLSQTYGDVEVLVVDDGSVDDTREVISGLDERVRYICQPNAGVSAARNTGLEAASGEYIAFLDSDDAWLPWKLEAQLSVLRSFPEAGMVWTDMKAVDDKGAILYESYLKRMYSAYAYFDREKHFRTTRPIPEAWAGCPAGFRENMCYAGNIFPWMFMGNLVHTSTVLLRRERQQKVGLFDTTLLTSGEDYDYHFRTCRYGEVAYLDAPSILYRIGASDQLTEKKYMVWIARNNLKTITRMLAAAGNEITLPRKMVREHLASSYAWLGFEVFCKNQPEARSCFLNSLRYAPFQPKVAVHLMLALLPSRAAMSLRSVIGELVAGGKKR